MAHGDWVLIASRRLPNILRRVRYASIRQLESKICEAGPADMRPSPIHLREALEALTGNGHVVKDNPPNPPGLNLPTFYAPSGFSVVNPADAARRTEVLDLYDVFLRAGQEDRGKTLEWAVYKAAQQAQVAGSLVTVIGSPDRPPDVGMVLNGVQIEEAPDLILMAREGVVVLEDKNLREWLAPWSHEVWQLLAKALRHDALPILVCRKATYALFLMFKGLGALAFQMHTQLFPQGFADRLAAVKHRDGLGFADIRYGDEPRRSLIRFVGDTIPRLLGERLERFRQHRELLREYAVERGLKNDLPGHERQAIYREFFRAFKGWEEEPPEEDYDWAY